MEYEQLEMRRFIAAHGLTQFQFNPHFPVNTVQIMRGAIAAGDAGVLAPYVEAVFHHMWEAPKKMDDPDVIAAALAASGLDAEALMAAAQSQPVKDRLLRQHRIGRGPRCLRQPQLFRRRRIVFRQGPAGRGRRTDCDRIGGLGVGPGAAHSMNFGGGAWTWPMPPLYAHP